MLKNYLTIIWRNLYRQPAYALLNLSCLAIGISAALLILLYLDFEFNYDRFHEKADRIYRIETNSIKTAEKTIDVGWQSTPALLGPNMQKEYPEIENYTRFFQFFSNEVKLEWENTLTEVDHLVAADSSALDIFTFDFIAGDPLQALHGPNKIVLSESLAQQIFGKANPLGKVLKSSLVHVMPDIDTDYSFIVSGVFQDLPDNSYLQMNALISSQSDPYLSDYYFRRFTFNTYALLNKEANPEEVATKLSGVYRKYLDPDIEMFMEEAIHELVPLTEIHMRGSGGYTYLYIFAGIGFLLLLIAGISYVNLVTAQASKRALEIGVRKVMGSNRRQLILQFLSESMAFSLLSMGIALGLVISSIGPLNGWLNLQLNVGQLQQGQVMLGILGIFLTLGLLGGSYPAFFLSSFQPISVLKGKISKGAPLRRMLVAIQFVVVIFVLVSTGMVYEQLQFLRQKDLGFNRENVVRIALPPEEESQKSEVLKKAFEESPLISSVGSSSFTPGAGMPRRPISADNGPDQESQFVRFGSIDYDYLETLDIALVDGRNFSSDHPNDEEEAILVNETLARNFGLDNPVGEKVRFGDKDNPNFVRIVGLVEDFHESSLHSEINSQMFMLEPHRRDLSVKISGDVREGIQYLEGRWKGLFPNAPFAYQFLEEDIQANYELDQIRGKIFMLFSILTIFIAFLGLFGLASYIVRQRVREIGIRKVLGAGIWDVVLLIVKDFMLLVSLAALPAFVLAWYFINQWLEDFAYRAEMNYLIFGLVLLFTLLLTFVTTGWHAARATQLNPAETLKYE